MARGGPAPSCHSAHSRSTTPHRHGHVHQLLRRRLQVAGVIEISARWLRFDEEGGAALDPAVNPAGAPRMLLLLLSRAHLLQQVLEGRSATAR